MCSSKSKPNSNMTQENIGRINGRLVLQPKSNQVPALDRRNSLKKPFSRSPIPLISPPISPKSKPLIHKEVSSSLEKVDVTRLSKSKPVVKPVVKPGSIAAARREEVAMKQEERKKKIAHYGRTKSMKSNEKIINDDHDHDHDHHQAPIVQEKKRCSFITATSDPIYVAYHDEEWGVPVYDDKLLFELLVLTGVQVGSDWTSILKKRNDFREAFCGFDAEQVAKFNEKKIQTISNEYGIDLSKVLAAIDNSKQILKVKREFGSFNKYLWSFVKYKPIITKHTLCQKIPVKTSKSETISKDMIRRGFRFVGPTVIYSLMQAAGMTNDHLLTCHRYLQCTALAAQPPVAAVAPAL